MSRKKTYDEREADKALQSVLGHEDPDGNNLGLLIQYFNNGYDLSKLRALLLHEDEGLVSHGAYILSELGEHGRPLFEVAQSLLHNRNPQVRYYAIDSLLSMSEPQDNAATARVLGLILDLDESVRRKVIDFIARKNISSLEAAATVLPDSINKESHLLGLKLVTNASVDLADEIETRLRSTDEIVRSYALAAAIRLLRTGANLIRRASRSADTVIQTEAQAKRKTYNI
jgi:hypothetical protein